MTRAAMYDRRPKPKSQLLIFVVEAPPVPCARARVTIRPGRKAHAFNPPATTKYKLLVQETARAAARQAGWVLDDEAEYGLEIDVYRAARRGDIDNFYKGIADAMIGVIYRDDAQVAEIHVRKRIDKVRPRAEILIFRLPDARLPANDNDRTPPAKVA